jgi:WD40 repeat protein
MRDVPIPFRDNLNIVGTPPAPYLLASSTLLSTTSHDSEAPCLASGALVSRSEAAICPRTVSEHSLHWNTNSPAQWRCELKLGAPQDSVMRSTHGRYNEQLTSEPETALPVLLCDMATCDNILVGDDIGVLRCIERPEDRAWGEAVVSSTNGDMDKTQAIQCLSQAAALSGDVRACVAAGRRDGTTSIHDASSCSRIISIPAACGDESIVSSLCWLSSAEPDKPTLLVAHENGKVFKHGPQDIYDMWGEWYSKAAFQCGNVVQCCDVHSSGRQFAAGGEGTEVCVYDMSTGGRQIISVSLSHTLYIISCCLRLSTTQMVARSSRRIACCHGTVAC